MNKTPLAILVLITSEAVLQFHGVCFWKEHAGVYGWLWSVALGVAALGFWLHHTRWVRCWLGVVASVLLLAGPLLQVGTPLLTAIDARAALQSVAPLQLELLQRSETEVLGTLQGYQASSADQRRSGFADHIDKATETLRATRQQMVDVTALQQRSAETLLDTAVIVVQLVALVVLQMASIVSLLVLRGVAVGPVTVVSGNAAVLSAAGNTEKKRPRDATWRAERSKTVATDKAMSVAELIGDRIRNGVYGDQPTMRQVMAGEKQRHPMVSDVFAVLVLAGVLAKDGVRYRLVKAGKHEPLYLHK